jgi:hypothetical protein
MSNWGFRTGPSTLCCRSIPRSTFRNRWPWSVRCIVLRTGGGGNWVGLGTQFVFPERHRGEHTGVPSACRHMADTTARDSAAATARYGMALAQGTSREAERGSLEWPLNRRDPAARPPVPARALVGAGSGASSGFRSPMRRSADPLRRSCLRTRCLKQDFLEAKSKRAGWGRQADLPPRRDVLRRNRALPLGNTGCSGGPGGWGARYGPSCPRKVATRSRCYHSELLDLTNIRRHPQRSR